jgi:hypothetical protein
MAEAALYGAAMVWLIVNPLVALGPWPGSLVACDCSQV